MDTKSRRDTDAELPRLRLIEQVLSLTELCEHLHVTPQTIYDLRSQGRGPRGFRVGRELRFRVSEIEACWLAWSPTMTIGTRSEVGDGWPTEDGNRHVRHDCGATPGWTRHCRDPGP